MRLSTKGEYGLLAIVDLALHANQGPVQSFQVAEREHIPKQYLDQLMLSLKKAGLVESSRGRQGGCPSTTGQQHYSFRDCCGTGRARRER
jgi:Rrf2 family protein